MPTHTHPHPHPLPLPLSLSQGKNPSIKDITALMNAEMKREISNIKTQLVDAKKAMNSTLADVSKTAHCITTSIRR